MHSQFGRIRYSEEVHLQNAEVGFTRVGGGFVGPPEVIGAADSGVGADDVDFVGGGCGEGVFEEGELGGEGGHVCGVVGAV